MVKNPHYRCSRGASPAAARFARFSVASGGAGTLGALPARFRRLRIAVIGAGDVGQRLVAALRARLGDRVAVLAATRRPEQAHRLRGLGARIARPDLDRPDSVRRLGGWPQVVIQLAPPPATGGDDPRTRNLLAALRRAQASQAPARRGAGHRIARPSAAAGACWVYASTTGVYGDLHGRWADETQPVAPTSERARRRLAAERRWRQAGAAGCARTPIVRVPGIYGRDRLPDERLRKGLPALDPASDVYTNHINADDLAWILWIAALRGRTNRVYHAVDDSDLKMGDYFDAVADALGLPRPPRLDREGIERAVSPAMLSFMSESRRLRNDRLRRELRVRLRYPTVQDTLAAC